MLGVRCVKRYTGLAPRGGWLGTVGFPLAVIDTVVPGYCIGSRCH